MFVLELLPSHTVDSFIRAWSAADCMTQSKNRQVSTFKRYQTNELTLLKCV